MRLGLTRAEMPRKTCDACCGSGEVQCEGQDVVLCDDCDGVGRVFAETPRLVLQRLECGNWRSLLLLGSDFGSARSTRQRIEAAVPGTYRLVQEQDQEVR